MGCRAGRNGQHSPLDLRNSSLRAFVHRIDVAPRHRRT
jgi:hypothetical protein